MDIIFNAYHHSHCSIRPTEETFRADCEEVRKHLCCDLRDIERALQQMATTYRVFDGAVDHESVIAERLNNVKLTAGITRKQLEQSGVKQAAMEGMLSPSVVTVETGFKSLTDYVRKTIEELKVNVEILNGIADSVNDKRVMGITDSMGDHLDDIQILLDEL